MKIIMELALLIVIIAEFYLHFSIYKLSERVDNFEEWVVFLLQKRNDGTTQVVRCRECKHREEYPCKVYHDDDWYCADGEREGE